ncbi:MAG: LacI family DNA-binding transcriptional regulator [Brevefilum sp.]
MVKRKQITINDLAEKAGVSISTVSRVINNKDYVSAETRSRVEAAIADLNFQPDPSARELRGMPSKLVALVIPDILNVYYTALSKEIESKLKAKGYTMLLGITHDQTHLMRDYIEKFSKINIDGLIYVPPPGRETSPYIRSLALTGLPILEINRRREEDLFFGVEADNFGAVTQALDHLYTLGHRQIAMLVGSQETTTGMKRLEGYRYYMNKQGIPINPALIKVGEFSRAFGEKATRELLADADNNPFTAIFPTSNRLLMGAMGVLREKEIDIPKDLSVIAMDDAEWLEVFCPAITTVDVALEEMASLTVDLLLGQIESDASGETPRTYTLSSSLKIRDSCNPIDDQNASA